MANVVLTTVAHAMTYLSDRTLTANVYDALAQKLVQATALIKTEIRADFEQTVTELLFDTEEQFVPLPGVLNPTFTRAAYPSFTLPVSGPISGLVVKYRGDTVLDEDFSWDDVDALVLNRDYQYQPGTGRIRLLFHTAQLVSGIRVSYASGYTATLGELGGAAGEAVMLGTGYEGSVSSLAKLLTGPQFKMIADADSYAGTAPELFSLALTPPNALGLHRVQISAPQNGGVCSVDQPLTCALYGGPDGSETLLDTVPVAVSLPGQVITLSGVPTTAYPRYRVAITGAADATMRVSLISPSFADASVQHLRDSAPPELTEACAILAAHLYTKGLRDGIGKTADRGNRAYSAGVFPPEVLQLLRPFREPRVVFI